MAQQFTDLTLDNPDLSGLTPVGTLGMDQGPASNILPGWIFTQDGYPVTQVYYARIGVGAFPYSIILTQNASSVDPVDFGPFSLHLSTSVPPPPFGGPGLDIRMSQTGQVPENATGLQLAANARVQCYIDGSLQGVADPGQNGIPVFNVTQYAGKVVNLEFRFPQNASLQFDILGFQPVPEPSSWALFGIGAGAVGWRAWRRRKC
jgi:hypothetical protein